MGLFFGEGRHPQKSLPYNKIGFMSESNKICSDSCGCVLKQIPVFFLRHQYAFNPLDLKSSNAELISPDGVKVGSKYLLSRPE